jgi:hypothetical protein
MDTNESQSIQDDHPFRIQRYTARPGTVARQNTSNILAILFSKYNNQRPVPGRDRVTRNYKVTV